MNDSTRYPVPSPLISTTTTFKHVIPNKPNPKKRNPAFRNTNPLVTAAMAVIDQYTDSDADPPANTDARARRMASIDPAIHTIVAMSR